ncbi:MAG: glycoside hydrolase family 16 protein [Firmicutes bacterium]|nr:glycoside hydrolase family 16 protein [Bacillota bacterium]
MQAILEKIFSQRELNAIYDLGPFLRELFSFPGLKRAGALLLAIFEIFPMLLFGTPRTPVGPRLDLTGYHAVFEDNFDADTLDTAKWEYRGTGTRSGGFMHPDQVRTEGGKLILTAEYLEGGAFGPGWYSGMLRTAEEFTYGYYEMTCVCSKGGGFWSAWWLNAQGMASAEASKGGVGGAEIDIFEAFCYKDKVGKDAVSLNVHVGGYGDGLQSLHLGSWRGKDIYTQYNTYGLLWTETEYIFYINGVEAVRTAFKDGVSRAPEYGIISLELPDAEALNEQPGFSTQFVVDSVRILQKD